MYLLICLIALAGQICAQEANIWPLPQSTQLGTTVVNLDPGTFSFVCAGPSCSQVITSAFDRYYNYIFFANNAQRAKQNRGDIHAESAASYVSQLLVYASSVPALDIINDESYTLTVNETTAVIAANTEWGALRGIETFSQLVDWVYDTNTYVIGSVPVSIQDSPRFPWRGLLIDCARHYEPLSQIFKALDAMSFNKFNVLHWHIVDDQSFPFQSITYPLLSQKGSWVPRAIYTPDDVQQVIDYGYLRGIRVVPEFDTPGHSRSWRPGYPQLFPNCSDPDVFNPTTSYTLNFMTGFLKEVAARFTDPCIHLGGDEVSYDCWQQDNSIAQWMAAHNISGNYTALQAYYENKVQGIVDGYGKFPVFWEEVYDNSLPGTLNSNTIVHVWFSSTDKVGEVAQGGFRVLFSSAWYLDKQNPDPENFYLFEDTWIDFYTADPVFNQTLTPQQLALVLGGEACMWGEQVDEHVFDARVWPRASAIAERLWSSEDVQDVDAATPRLGFQRCRMVRRGINASPIYPDYCETGRN